MGDLDELQIKNKIKYNNWENPPKENISPGMKFINSLRQSQAL